MLIPYAKIFLQLFKNQLAILKLGKNQLNAEITYFKMVKNQLNTGKFCLKISQKLAKYRIFHSINQLNIG